MQKFYDGLAKFIGYLGFLALPASIFFWIWTGEWRYAASVGVAMIALFLLAVGAKLVLIDEEKAMRRKIG